MDFEEWQKRFKESGIPECIKCGTPMINGIDSITKKKSEYIWEYTCECNVKGLQISIGGK